MNSIGKFPVRRMRRNRRDNFSRALLRENEITVDDLIYPVFITDEKKNSGNISAMPGLSREDPESLMTVAEQCLDLGIPAIALFPVIPEQQKTLDASESFREDGLVPRVVRTLKTNFPDLGVITDVALDPYTSHGQDGIVDSDGYVMNDETIQVLIKQASCHAVSGADIVAPSDMMDGRVGAIRTALDDLNYSRVRILSYAAKYASSFYGPFREAIGSAASLGSFDKKSYQLDPGNANEALLEVGLDLEEGADIVMIKPGMPYLDVLYRVKHEFRVPVFVYQVSGEYSMLKAAGKNGWLDEASTVMESLICFKRAGADAILTYFALDVARRLKSIE